MKTLTEGANRNLLNLYLPLLNQLVSNSQKSKQKIWIRRRRQPIVSSTKNQWLPVSFSFEHFMIVYNDTPTPRQRDLRLFIYYFFWCFLLDWYHIYLQTHDDFCIYAGRDKVR